MAENPHRPAVPEIRRRIGGRSARVQSAVLAAALELLATSGLTGFSIAAVAERSGVHPTSIYRRWGTPEALALAACLGGSAEALPIPDTGTLEGDLRRFCRSLRTWLQSARGRTLLDLGRSAEAQDGEAQQRFWATRFTLAAAMFERAAARGEIAGRHDAKMLVETLIAPLYLRLLVTGEPLGDRVIDHTVEVILAALGVQRGRRR